MEGVRSTLRRRQDDESELANLHVINFEFYPFLFW